jgi:hypothetical protein
MLAAATNDVATIPPRLTMNVPIIPTPRAFASFWCCDKYMTAFPSPAPAAANTRVNAGSSGRKIVLVIFAKLVANTFH